MGLPSLQDVFLEFPLYRTVKIDSSDAEKLSSIIGKGDSQIDAHCIYCGKESIFFDSRSHRFDPQLILGDRLFTVALKCKRNSDHTYWFAFKVESELFSKVGQNPSHADLANVELNKYRKVLGNPRSAELRRAVGLAANGVGVGAFVYLRRIFESLLSDHKDQFEAKNGPIKNWDNMRVQERVNVLSSILPPALVTHKIIYGIVSKGIHELEEVECLSFFEVLKQAIILILEQDEINRQRVKNEAGLARAIAQISSKLGNDAANGDV